MLFYLLLTHCLISFARSDQFFKFETQHQLLDKKLKFKPSHSTNDFPFRNTSLPIKDRVDDLVSRLTIQELAIQLARGGANTNGPAPAIDRLGISAYNWNNEGIHGYVSQKYSTGFPSPVGLAAMFNKSAVVTMAQTIAVEARASFNMFRSDGNFGDHTCLSLFAPVINIMRHPLWGRNQETYGEDPVLTSYLARQYINGLQTTRHGIPGATSVCKHFGVHNGPENIPSSRFSFNAQIDEFDFGQTFMMPFLQCVWAGTHGVMCSYNAINGVPACANNHTITEVLRGKFGFQGYVVSDEGAIENIDLQHHYTKTHLETAVAAKLAGVDLELAIVKLNSRFSLLEEAVNKSLLSEDELRTSAKRLFTVRMILGEFDPADANPWNQVTTAEILSPAHRKIAADIAEQSYVLLKNDGVLPIKKLTGRIAFLGPFANNTDAVTGDYATNPNGMFTTPADSWMGMSAKPPNIASGCVGAWDKDLPLCHKYDGSAVKAAITTDVGLIVVTVGTGTNIEAEGRDRENTSLPANQYQLIEDAVTYGSTLKIPVVVLIYSAAPVLIDDVYNNVGVSAIFMCHFPAQSAGTLAPVMLGENVPAARLPYTWYNANYQLPSITDYNVSTNGLTYRYTEPGNVLFPFGFGLSYTQFSYGNLQVTPTEPSKCQQAKVQIEVTNKGHLSADEVVQVYVQLTDDAGKQPIRIQLVAFERVHVAAQSTVHVDLAVEQFSTAIWKSQGGAGDYHYYVIPGTYTVFVGGQQPGQMRVVGSNIVEGSFTRKEEHRLTDCSH